MVQNHIAYRKETRSAHFQGQPIVIKNPTPILASQGKGKKEIEKSLYDVFSKYSATNELVQVEWRI